MTESHEDHKQAKESMSQAVNRIYLIIVLLGIAAACMAQTKKQVYNEIVRQGIKHPDVVVAQFRLETGNGTSKKCVKYKNLFGMKLATQRETTALGEVDDYAYYSHWTASVKDYKIWQDKYYKGGNYYEFLHNMGYATSTKYIKKLKEFKIENL